MVAAADLEMAGVVDLEVVVAVDPAEEVVMVGEEVVAYSDLVPLFTSDFKGMVMAAEAVTECYKVSSSLSSILSFELSEGVVTYLLHYL